MSKLLGSILLAASFVCFLASVSADGDAKGPGKSGGKKIDVDELFKKLDLDGNGKLSRDEFLKLADKAPDAEKQTKAREFLGKVYDKIAPNNGVTLEQLKKFQEAREQKLKKKAEPK